MSYVNLYFFSTAMKKGESREYRTFPKRGKGDRRRCDLISVIK